MSDPAKRPGAEPEKPLPAHAISLAEELQQPNMTEKLLNAQLAEALFLMRDAGFLYRNSELGPTERGPYIHHAESMMASSVKIAERIAQLNGTAAAPEKRFRYIVEHVEGGRDATAPGGEGSAIPENE